MDANKMMLDKTMETFNTCSNSFQANTTLDTGTWMKNPTVVEQVNALMEMCRGNARLLYGSERFKFFDVVIFLNDSEGKYGAGLVCSQNGATKVLRKEVGDCPLVVIRAIFHSLQKDTGKLFSKIDVGDQIYDQQGYTDAYGVFQLDPNKMVIRDNGGLVDDTKTMMRDFKEVPRVPRCGKRPRGNSFRPDSCPRMDYD